MPPAGFLSSPLRSLPGVGPATEERLAALGLTTVGDLLYHLPVRYLDRSQIVRVSDVRPGSECLVRGVLSQPTPLFGRKGRLVQARVSDETGSLRCVWFGAASWIERWAGREVLLAGKASLRSPPALLHPEVHDAVAPHDPYVAVYRLTSGISHRRLRALIARAVDMLPDSLPTLVPEDCAVGCATMSLATAFRQAHFPSSAAEGFAAQERIRLERMIPLHVTVMRLRAERERRQAPAMSASVRALSAFLRSLPFTLTSSQARALADIRRDLARPLPMHRLLQGDVGSGKTVVAAGAAIIALSHGYQVAFMAPTEVLADQHGRVVRPWIHAAGYPCEILTGATAATERTSLLRTLSEGLPTLVIGTHALLEESVAFGRLGLVIIDEQHRFGLNQRAVLTRKGEVCHVLVMTATPIPRSLAMTMYGHLDLSVMSEKPPGRKPVKTLWFEAHRRHEALEELCRAVRSGEQALVVAPLVEDSDALEARAAVTLFDELHRGPLRGVAMGLVHGRMPAAQKDDVVQAFRTRALQVLVCTTVIEVGLDAPGASMLLIDGAERFGLAQLHQLRGRIGRGGQDATCVLVTGSEVSEEARRRLQALLSTEDGFRLAEIDLALRGPGSLLGPAQHGRFGDLTANPRLIALAQRCARRIVEDGLPPGVRLGDIGGIEEAIGAG